MRANSFPLFRTPKFGASILGHTSKVLCILKVAPRAQRTLRNLKADYHHRLVFCANKGLADTFLGFRTGRAGELSVRTLRLIMKSFNLIVLISALFIKLSH